MVNKMIRHGVIGFGVAGDISKLEKADKLLNRMPKQAERVKRAMSEMMPQRAFNETMAGYKRVTDAANKYRDATDSVKRGHQEYANEAVRASKKAISGWNRVNTAEAKARSGLDKATNAAKRSHEQMGASSEKMSQRTGRAMIQTHGHVEKARGSFNRLYDAGSRLSNMGSMVTMALLPVGAAFKKAADDATELENKYTTVKNLLNTGGESAAASKRETAAMEKENNGFALKYGVDPKDMASGGEELIRRGYSGKQELASHNQFLQAARASGDDYNSVVRYGASTLEKFGYKTKAGESTKKMRDYTKRVLNQMAYGADLTATDFTGMGNALNMAGATAHSTHQSMANTISELGVLSNNGLDGTLSGTGLRKVLNAFASPYTSLKSRQGQAINSYGIDTSKFYDKRHNLKSLPDLLDYLNSRTKGLSESQKLKFQNKFFGATGQEAGNFLMTNTSQIRNLSKRVNRSQDQKGGGYIASLSKKNMQSWQNQINRTKQYLNIMGQGFAKTVLPGFTRALKTANGLLKVFIDLPKPVKTAAGYATAIAASAAAAVTSYKLLGKLGGFLFSKSGGTARVGAVQSVADLASSGAIPTEGRRSETRMGRRGTSRISKLGRFSNVFGGSSRSAVSEVENVGKREAYQLANRGTAARLLTGTKVVASRVPWLDVAMSATSLIGMNKHNAGSKIGNFGGTLAGMEGGAALGSLLGPVGTLVGGGLGAAAGGFAGSHVGKSIQHAVTRPSKAIQGAQYVPGVGTVYMPNSSSERKANSKPQDRKGSAAWDYKHLSSQNASLVHKAVKLEQQGNVEWANSAGKTTKKLRGTYNSLYELAKKRADSHLNSTKKGYDYLKRAGLMSASASNSAYGAEKTSVEKRVSSLRSGLKKMLSNDKMSGAQRTRAIDKVNRQILNLIDKGTGKQKSIMAKLMGSTTHLTTAGYAKILTSSRKNERQTVKSAQKTYDAEVSSADKRYSKAKKLAKSLPGLSEKQRQGVLAEAKKQHDQSIDKAHHQYKRTVYWAEEQRKNVVAKAKEEAGQAAAAFSTAAVNIGKSIPALLQSNASAFGGKYQKPKTDTKALKDYYGLNSLPTAPSPIKPSRKKKVVFQKKTTPSLPGGPHLATGSLDRYPHGLPHDMRATVNDGGSRELIIPPAGQMYIARKMNQQVLLKKGTHVLNGRDTKRVVGNVHLASGTVSLSPTPRLSGKKVKTGIEGTKKKYDKELRGSKRAVSSFKKSSKSDFGKIKSDTTDKVSDTTSRVTKDYKRLKKSLSGTTDDISKEWRSSWKSMVNFFGDTFGRLKPYAHKGMAGAISSLNGGFTGINSALAQFGGNKSVLKPIHYAAGSHGPITSDRLAVLNDDKNGPRQELVARGRKLLRPIGNDVVVPLKRGDEVFNGRQVEKAKPYLPHFKKGTGASDSKLRSLAKSNAKSYDAAFKSEFSDKVKPSGSTLQRGITGTTDAGSKTIGPAWTKAMWGYIESLIDSGGGVGGGPVLHSPGAGWNKSSGFGNRGGTGGGYSSHDGNDFSGGRTVHSLQDSVVKRVGGPPSGWGGDKGIGQSVATLGGKLWLIYQELNGKAGSGASILVHTGQHIKQGQPIAKLGPSGTHVHIGASTEGLWSHGGGSTRGWLDVTKLRGNYGNHVSKKAKSDSRITKLVKSQLGPTAVKWIKKHLQDSIGDANVGSLSGSVVQRAKTLAAAIKRAYSAATNSGIAAVLGNWSFESGLQPGIQNSIGASGLGQWLGGRATALRNFAKKHGKSWKNAGVQIEFALKGDESDSSILKSVLRGRGSVASLANRFSSQWERGGYNAQHVAGARKIEAALHNSGGWSKKGKLNIFGEKDPEVAINPKKPNADSLIGSAIQARAKVNDRGLAGRLNRTFNTKKMKADNDSLYKEVVASLRKMLSGTTSRKAVTQPQAVVNLTVNFNGPVDKDTADYATGNIQKTVQRELNRILSNMTRQTQNQMHLD